MTNNLTKKEIVLKIHEHHKKISQQEALKMVQMILDTIGDALQSGRNVELRNFGVFKIQNRKSRVGRNPNQPDKDVIIPDRKVIKFLAGKELKEKIVALKL